MQLVSQPKLILLDEPAAGQSEEELAAFSAILRRISDNTTVLIVEHNVDFVRGIAETVTVLDHGDVLAEGDPDTVFNNRDVVEAYMGPANSVTTPSA